jgi:SAM-dependent methyltransferase
MNHIDTKQLFDPIKLMFYYEHIMNQHLYDEGPSQFHKQLTEQVIQTYIDPLELPKDAKILDMGCGVGYFLDAMRDRGYTDVTGICVTPEDIKTCEDNGHNIKQYDMSFLPQKDGYYDESVDFIFARQSLEHSPFPIFTLMEYNRVLKQGGKLYVELPAPDCERKHEYNPNHYSILGANQWAALFLRTGFDIEKFNNLDFDLNIPVKTEDGNEELKTVAERYYCIVITKARPMDIK